MKLKISGFIFLILRLFLLVIFLVVCLNKIMFLALSMCDSILTTLESHLSRYYECINMYLSCSVSGFSLPQECCNHLSSIVCFFEGGHVARGILVP